MRQAWLTWCILSYIACNAIDDTKEFETLYFYNLPPHANNFHCASNDIAGHKSIQNIQFQSDGQLVSSTETLPTIIKLSLFQKTEDTKAKVKLHEALTHTTCNPQLK